MTRAGTVNEILAAIENVKAGAPAFCTNFFPTQKKLQAWTERGELTFQMENGAAFFFRRDRDFQRFYFCASSAAALQHAIANVGNLKTERIVTDLVGNDATLQETLDCFERAGFRRYSQLQRMARAGKQPATQPRTAEADVILAKSSDRQAILELLDTSFDHYSDQLPAAHEIDAAIEGRQILAIRCDGELAAMLFFETQGFTSAIRYWVVAPRFQSKRLGAALIRHYFASQNAVKRFVLWVVATNENAVKKYQHYGYAADGLIDRVLVNAMIEP
jgi:ribosomal protein S18 acetylase RimI-like enzyme